MKLDWKTCFRVGTSIFVLYLAICLVPAAMEFGVLLIGAAAPLLVGGVIAYLVNILMNCYERRWPAGSKAAVKLRRPLCMLAAFVTMFAVVGAVVALVVPQLASCIRLILAELPDYLVKTIEWLGAFGILPEDIVAALEEIDWRSRIGQIAQVLTSGLGSVVDVVFAAVSSVFSWLVALLVGLIFSIYLLFGKERLAQGSHKLLHHYLKPHWCETIDYVLAIVDDSFHRYIVGQCTEAVIIGVLCALGMTLLRLPCAAMTGALIGFTALIPVAGAYIGAAVGAFMILTVSPVKALVFLVFIVVLQQLEGNIIYPRVVGSSLGLPGIWVLSAVTIGGGVMGIFGMLLGVPLVAALYQLVRNDVNGTKLIDSKKDK